MNGWPREDDDVLSCVLNVIGVVGCRLCGAGMGVDSMPIKGVSS